MVTNKLLKEFCCENGEGLAQAITGGAERIELCDHLDLGGLTPQTKTIETVTRFAHLHQVEVVSMVRLRGGNFIFSDAEKAVMKQQARQALQAGVDGIVFGALTNEGDVDWPFIKELAALLGDRQAVFHMAFDQLSREVQMEAVKKLAAAGISRLLTRGGLSGTALEHADWINQLIKAAGSELHILPGGGIHYANLFEASQLIHADQFHGTRIIDFVSK